MIRGKRTSYEAGVRVPLIIRWPAGIEAGLVRDELVSLVDLAPTMLDAAGLPQRTDLPGKSLQPLMRDAETSWREFLFTEFHTHSAHNYYPQRTVRNARYKLIHNLLHSEENPGYQYTLDTFYETLADEIESAPQRVRTAYERMQMPPEYELYDLQDDPYEFDNLAADPEHAGRLAELQTELAHWRKRTKDPLLDPRNIRRLQAEISACNRNGEFMKERLTLTYPQYFYAIVSEDDVPRSQPQP